MPKSSCLSHRQKYLTRLDMGSVGRQFSIDWPPPHCLQAPGSVTTYFPALGDKDMNHTGISFLRTSEVTRPRKPTNMYSAAEPRGGWKELLLFLAPSLPSCHCKPCLLPKAVSLETTYPSIIHYHPVLLRSCYFACLLLGRYVMIKLRFPCSYLSVYHD